MPRKLFGFVLVLLIFTTPVWAQISFTLKSAPEDLDVYFNNELIRPLSSAAGHRNYRIANAGILRFSAEGYDTIEYHSDVLPVRNGIVGIKLEITNGMAEYRGEYATGRQPKSVYFSPNGQWLFVPLLENNGIDVFSMTGELLRYERRLTVPGSRAVGFVEAMFDEARREIWFSNFEDNRVHIYDLDTLEYKMSSSTGGVLSKVITQSNDGRITVVSNWVTMCISVFDSDTKQMLRRIRVGGTPRGMAFSPDDSLLYVAIYDAPLIIVVDMARNTIVQRFRFATGHGAARHVIYWEDKLYVSDMGQGTVNILDPATGTLLRSAYVGPNINTIALSPDGQYIAAASRGINNPIDYTRPGPDFGAVYILRADDLSLQEKIWGRNQPTGLSFSPDGRFLAFTDFLDQNLQFYRFHAGR